jgi:hypothetical protein
VFSAISHSVASPAPRRSGRASRRAVPAPFISLCLRTSFFAVLLWCVGSGVPALADNSLHDRIDQLLDAAQPGGAAPLASDADFVRRAYLALNGVIPTAAQTRTFINDTGPNKRAQLVDELVESSDFTRWMALRLDVMLMERRAEKHVKVAPWRQFLEASVVANKPWNQLVRELLSDDGTDDKTRAVARWCLEREGDPHALTRDIGRIFFGRDMGCAQCHDHPRIDDYLQRDYYGLEAFVSRTYLFQPDMNKPGVLGERADGDVAWTSVFTKVSGNTRPRLPQNLEIGEPSLPAADMWVVAPNDKDKNLRPVPRYSRRAQLAVALSDGTHPAFRRNIANRLWAFIFGRGLVEPLDLHHSANPPTQPALLDLLSDAIASMNFDMKAFLRELALTRAFQRSLDLPEPSPEIACAAFERIPALEEEARSVNNAARQSEEAWSETRQKFLQTHRDAEPLAADLKKQDAAVAEATKAVDAAAAEVKKADEALIAKRGVQMTLAEAAAKAGDAATKAPESEEVVAAAKLFQTKAEQAANDVTSAEKELSAKKDEAETKAKAVVSARQLVDAARAKLDEARQGIARIQDALDAAATRKQTDRVRARHASRLLSEAKAVAKWVPLASRERPVREEAARSDGALAEVRRKVEELSVVVNGAPARIVSCEEAANAAMAQLASTRETIAQRRAAVTALAEASAKAAEAAAKLSKDAEIQSAATALKTRADAAAAEVAAMERTIAEAPGKAEAATKAAAETRAAAEKAAAELELAQPQLAKLEAEAKSVRTRLDEIAAPASAARDALTTAWSESFAASALVALQPEQLCWSVMQATGILEQQRAQATAEWDQKNPLSEEDKSNAAKQAERAAGIARALADKVRPHEDQYVRSFGGAAGQPQTEFFATPEQALYFENGGVLRGWAGVLATRLAALTDPKTMAEELYLSALTRFPTDAEVGELKATLAARPAEKKGEALTDTIWALLTSNEFRFAH